MPFFEKARESCPVWGYVSLCARVCLAGMDWSSGIPGNAQWSDLT